ncbi:MAG: thiamine phosphate synthase [Prevotella sp.]|nr:thiamine phosphate synthase [Prevotella sp.]
MKNFKRIAVTSPVFTTEEVTVVCRLLDDGFWRIHVRKPESTEKELTHFLDTIPVRYRSRIVIHDHFALCSYFGLAGIHLNRRCTQVPEHFSGSLSCSCHTFEEVVLMKDKVDYIFLSPVFDSISKSGYSSAFTHEQLAEAALRGIIDHRVFALGGVTPDKYSFLQRYHFGGAAMLGAIWNKTI